MKDATTDIATISEWWSKWPDANIGMTTGANSGTVAIDVDPRHGGDSTLASLLDRYGDLPATVRATTGGGGEHILFKHPGGQIKSRPIAEGLDCKADGGYLVVAPSLHASGVRYVWQPGCAPGEIELAAVPPWLLEMVRLGKKGKSAGKERIPSHKQAKASGKATPSAGRNNTLTSLAGKLRRGGLEKAEICARLKEENESKFADPLDEEEVEKIAESVSKYATGFQCPYRGTPHGLVYDKPTQNGPVPVPLTNFTAKITADIEEDDGVEKTRRFEVQGQVAGCSPVTSTIPAQQFTGMSWHIPMLGSGAVVYPGHSAEAHTRTAIQLLSTDKEHRTVYGHTGWREIGGEWMYIHAGGAIGKGGNIANVHVSLTGGLERFLLPPPPESEALVESLRATRALFELGPARVMYPLLAGLVRAMLGGTGHSIFIVGRSGSFKSELSTLIQQHFGAEFTVKNLPGSWSSTANALEDSAFRAKDAIFVIDDFKPSGDMGADSKLNQQADRIFRGQGNGSGRQRMRSDGTVRAARPPRGLILATGEDLPRGESLRARLLTIDLTQGDITSEDLTRAQQASGLYSGTTAAFCKWMAANYKVILSDFNEAASEERARFQGGHARQPFILAESQVAFDLFLRFVQETTGEEVITAEQADRLSEACRKALLEAGEAQLVHQIAAEPTARFLELLGSAIASGRAHVGGVNEEQPEEPHRWGWRAEHNGSDTVHRGTGERIGWVEGDDLYLNPAAAFRVAQSTAPAGEGVPISEQTLRKRLKEKGLLASTDPGRNSLLIRKVIAGSRYYVLHLRAERLRPTPDLGEGERP